MIEKIKYKGKLFALIVGGKYRSKKGITFFTPDQATQQFGYMKHKKGYIITKGKTSSTSLDGVFAAGDIMDPTYKQAVTAAGTGCIAALDAEKYIDENI